MPREAAERPQQRRGPRNSGESDLRRAVFVRPASTVVNPHAKYRLCLFGGIRGIYLLCLRRIVLPHFERVHHLAVLQRPAPVIVLQVFRTILQPDADVALRPLTYQKRIIVAAENVFAGIRLIVPPLDAGKAAHVREHTAELIVLLPRGIEGADASRGDAGNGPAVSVLTDAVLRLDVSQNLVA